jgi:hypothetical protein
VSTLAHCGRQRRFPGVLPSRKRRPASANVDGTGVQDRGTAVEKQRGETQIEYNPRNYWRSLSFRVNSNS